MGTIERLQASGYKLQVIYILLIALTSCTYGFRKEDLYGSWTEMYDENKYPKNLIRDKMTFYRNDSFKVELFYKDQINNSFTGKYHFDEFNKQITAIVDGPSYTSRIIELTKTHLTIQNDSARMRSFYVRLME